jgi:hypothetical protein
MADIALGAQIRREFLTGFLQEIDSHGTRVASHSASGTQPHKLNDAAGHARCQIHNVVDRNPIVDDIAPVDVQLLEESGSRRPARSVSGFLDAGTNGRLHDSFLAPVDLPLGFRDCQLLAF